jgi:hypothetical protein
LPEFPGIPWEQLEEDIHIVKSNPAVSVEERTPNTAFPQADLVNPARTWRFLLDEAGKLKIRDLTANADRLVVDVDGKVSSIAMLAQDLLPDGNLTRSLGSATSRWLLNGWNPDAHASRHEYGGADPVRNLDYLAIRGTTVITSDRVFQYISSIRQGTLVLEWLESGVWYPRFVIQNLDKAWRFELAPAPGDIYFVDQSLGVTRLVVRCNTAADSSQLEINNTSGTNIFKIDYEGDVTIPGKLTQGACPEFSKMSLNEIKSFIKKCVSKPEPRKDGNGRDVCDLCNKPFSEDGCTDPKHWNNHIETHYHKTQEEVMALMHLVLNLAERVEQLEHRLGVA